MIFNTENLNKSYLNLELSIFSNYSSYFRTYFKLSAKLDKYTLYLPSLSERDTNYLMIIKTINTDLLGIKILSLSFLSKNSIINNFLRCSSSILPDTIITNKKINVNAACTYSSKYFSDDFWKTVQLNFYINNTILISTDVHKSEKNNSIFANNYGYLPTIENVSYYNYDLYGELIYQFYNEKVSLFTFNSTTKIFLANENFSSNQDLLGGLPVYFITISIGIIVVTIKKKIKVKEYVNDEK